MGTAEEFFHVFRIATWGMVGIGSIIDFNGADRAQGTFITKDKVDCFIFDVTICFVAILVTNFMTQKGGKADVGDNVEFLTEDVV